MKGLSKEELSWALYDWGNSAYSMTITSTILPIYFKMVAENSGMTSSNSTAVWGYTISISTLFVSLIAPVLGTIADYKGNKKKFFKFFCSIGILSTIMLALVPADMPMILLLNMDSLFWDFQVQMSFMIHFLWMLLQMNVWTRYLLLDLLLDI